MNYWSQNQNQTLEKKMKSNIKINNSAESCIIDIEGTIGIPEEWQFENPQHRIATYEKFKDTIQQIEAINRAKVIVNIRSTGGDVNDALLIYEALKNLDAHITTRCYGYTASAATIIAQAASEGAREISENALYLIHNSICATEGNIGDLEQRVELLRKTDERLAELYSTRSKSDVEGFKMLMEENNGNGRWLSPTEVIEAKLADKISISKEDEQTQSTITNIASRWSRIVAQFKREVKADAKSDDLPTDNNILHLNEPQQDSIQQYIIKMQMGQQAVMATKTESTEDPAINEATLSANAKAYNDDVRRMSQQ